MLFLDEFPEFARAALEALREPLETGTITIARAARHAEFPARFQLIAAMNPCPCGYLGAASKSCRCTPDQILRVGIQSYLPFIKVTCLHRSKIVAFSSLAGPQQKIWDGAVEKIFAAEGNTSALNSVLLVTARQS